MIYNDIMFGTDHLTSMLYEANLPYLDTPLTWEDAERRDPCDGKVRTQARLLSDQGSPEMRNWQLLYCWFEGVAFLPYGHRLSNNVKGLIPAIDASAAAMRRYLRGPLGTARNQGTFRHATERLIEEAEKNPQKAMRRPWAAQLKFVSRPKSRTSPRLCAKTAPLFPYQICFVFYLLWMVHLSEPFGRRSAGLF